MRELINLIETTEWQGAHVWYGTSKEEAKDIIDNGIEIDSDGFYCVNDPELLDDEIILEFQLSKKAKISNHHKEGIDAVPSGDGIRVFNKNKLKFLKVWSGVIDDPLTDDTDSLDEYAIEGFRRCTAVTVNALAKHFNKPGLTLSEVPEDNIGVLNQLAKRNLAYKPIPYNGTVAQFCRMHPRGAFYVSTPQHALAIINSEMFDSENRGCDNRPVLGAFEITMQ